MGDQPQARAAGDHKTEGSNAQLQAQLRKMNLYWGSSLETAPGATTGLLGVYAFVHGSMIHMREIQGRIHPGTLDLAAP